MINGGVNRRNEKTWKSKLVKGFQKKIAAVASAMNKTSQSSLENAENEALP